MRNNGNSIRLNVNDLVVSYNDFGPDDAPAIIFIHGFPLNKSMWNMQLKVLKDDFRVIAYDIRGHGESDAGNEAFSIDLFVNDLISFMNVLKIKKASLCGLSMGGYIASNAIENYPERFDALVLSDTNCTADSPEKKDKRMEAVERIIKNGVNKYADESVKNLFAPTSFTTKRAEIASVKEMIVNITELALCSTLLALSSRHETYSKLPELNVPVLILVGEEDVITPPAEAESIQRNIKNSSLQVIDNAGHLSNLENSEDFNSHLKKFFDSVYTNLKNTNIAGGNSILKELRNKLILFLSFRSI